MALLRLAALLFLLGLTVSRVGLLLHELAGHGGAAALFGCRLTGLRLFLFGGGYVEYDCPPLGLGAALAIDLGGIALELALGAALLGLARGRQGLLPLLAALAGTLFVLHGLFYLVTGVHDGAGDGRQLHRWLGAARPAFVTTGSLVLVAATFATARALARRLAGAVPAAGWGARIAALGAAALGAAALHGALLRAEQRVLADPVYAATFEPERERAIAVELERFARAQPRTPVEIEVQRQALAEEHAAFPLAPVLGAGMAAASLAGIAQALRRRREDGASLAGGRALAGAAAAGALALALTFAVDRLV